MLFQRQTILMCAPDFFGVEYVINPWMKNQVGRTDPALAVRQWKDLRVALVRYADLLFAPPVSGLPDMVFTANAGFTFGDKVIVSRFRSEERQGEEKPFREWFKERGFTVVDWPQDIFFEGAGDALFDRAQNHIWCGHGFRSDSRAAEQLEKIVGRKVVSVKLVDPRFYHMDTCLCPLEGGWLMYYPPAFDEKSKAKIEKLVPKEKRIIVSESDALNFSCNAVDLNKHVIMNSASDELQENLRQAGFTPVLVPLTEFLKAGGTAKCLTLKLVEA